MLLLAVGTMENPSHVGTTVLLQYNALLQMLGEIIGQVFLPWVPVNEVLFLSHLIHDAENLIFMLRVRCFFTVLFAIPTDVLLFIWTGLGDCG